MAETNVGWPLSVGAAVDKSYRAGAPGVPTAAFAVYDVVPVALDADGIAAAQAVAGAGNLTINGALASSGSVTLDVPRAVQILSTGAGDTTQTATFTGTDVYNQPMTETLTFNGTTAVSGAKAFKTVTRVAISAALAGNASAGSTDILGLPYYTASRNYVITAYDGAQVTTGTYVAGVTTTATATTGDVRGTYLVPSATDGSKRLTVYMYATNPDTVAGLYGVTQA